MNYIIDTLDFLFFFVFFSVLIFWGYIWLRLAVIQLQGLREVATFFHSITAAVLISSGLWGNLKLLGIIHIPDMGDFFIAFLLVMVWITHHVIKKTIKIRKPEKEVFFWPRELKNRM